MNYGDVSNRSTTAVVIEMAVAFRLKQKIMMSVVERASLCSVFQYSLDSMHAMAQKKNYHRTLTAQLNSIVPVAPVD
jgi:hypothetical protein